LDHKQALTRDDLIFGAYKNKKRIVDINDQEDFPDLDNLDGPSKKKNTRAPVA
jgi:hypothetical protein